MRKTKTSNKLPRRVLVVEDDAIIGFSIEEALLEAGVSDVEICTTTDAALDGLRRDQPDAIVLDVHLADRDDGWAIAELVQTLGPDRPQIIFSTGMPEAIPESVARLGCILEKPYDLQLLVDTLKKPEAQGLISRLRGAISHN